MNFAGVEITQDTIIATRAAFVAIYHACIDEAISGVVRVNDLGEYIAWRLDSIAAMERGESDHTFTFAQRAHSIQTGECVPFLPK